MLAKCALLSGSTGAGSDVLEHLVHLVFPTAGHLIHVVAKGLNCLGCTFGHSLEEPVLKKLGAPVKAGVWRVASPRTPSPAGGTCTLGARCLGGYAQVVQRGHAPLKVAVATQTSFLDYRKPLQSPTPKLKIELPGRAVSAGGSTASSSQTTTPPALTGQQSVPVSGEGAQTASPSQVGSATAKPVRSPRSPSRERGPRSHEKTSSSKERHSSCATPTPKGQEQEVSGASLPGTSTASLAGGGRGRRLAPRGQSLSIPSGKAVQRGQAPQTESKATQVSPEVLAVALQSPTPQQRQQLPLVSGGSAPAASRPRDRQGAPLAVSTPRCPPREKERESRPNSRERASSKEWYHAAPSTAEGRGRMELGDVQPSTSTAAPLSEGGRGRGVRPRTSTLPKPTQQASSQEVEATPQGAPVKAGVWRVASPRTPSHAGSPAHVWLCVAFPCLGKRESWWLSRARGRFGPFGAPRVRQYTTSAPASHRRESW
ncbi:hypothetical protein ISCGN_020900 [Ixodes scapularis]